MMEQREFRNHRRRLCTSGSAVVTLISILTLSVFFNHEDRADLPFRPNYQGVTETSVEAPQPRLTSMTNASPVKTTTVQNPRKQSSLGLSAIEKSHYNKQSVSHSGKSVIQISQNSSHEIPPIPSAGKSETFLQMERGPFGETWRKVLLERDDWVVYVRIQKTGSQTFWQTLHNNFDGSVWGRRARCQRGLFCGHRCEAVVAEQISSIVNSRQRRAHTRFVKDPNQCSLIFRGHINIFDYDRGFAAAGILPHRVQYITFLREPVSRAVSEYRHITDGLVAQVDLTIILLSY